VLLSTCSSVAANELIVMRDDSADHGTPTLMATNPFYWYDVVMAKGDAPRQLPSSAGEAQLRSILATVPDAMVTIDERGLILSFSAAAERLFGYSESEILGENVSMLMPPPDCERHDTYLSNYRRTGVRKIIGIGRVTTARHSDGNTFPIELSIGEAKVGGHRIFTGFIHDITERQVTQLRLHELQSELAHVGRVSEMSILASSLAHELNQPLTAIAGYYQGAWELLHGTLDDEAVKFLREVVADAAHEALRAGEIVRRMREFISRGDTEHSIESLPRLITEANALALVGSRELGIDVRVSSDPHADFVVVDRIQVQQVLFNLIRNAIDAMVRSPMRSLAISTSGGPTGFVTVSVQDSGSGISKEVAARLFEPFVTSKDSGMGIGLSICRTIIEGHGGRIWFENSPNRGTIFRFTLPRARGRK
jgi:two-component system sensor kinase FixL